MMLALNNLADLYREEEKHTEAEKYLESAVAVMDKALAPADPTRATLLRALAGVKQVMGKNAEAETLHLQVLDLAKASGRNDVKALGLLEVGSFYHSNHEDTRAEPFFSEALKLVEKDGESRNLAMALVATSECRIALGKTDVAATDLVRAHVMIERLFGKEHETMAQVLRAEGKCLLAQGKPTEAEWTLKEAKALSVKVAGPDDLTVGYTLELLGNVYTAQERLTEADRCYQEAAAIEEKFSNVAPLRLAENLEAYSRLLQKMQRTDDAGKQAKRAADLRAGSPQR
jgi:tetratricopeptide (TPR) repeat protein